MDVSGRLAELGLTLPPAPAALGSYVAARLYGGLVYTAGQLPVAGGVLMASGLVGSAVDVATASECARVAALNGLAAAASAAGGPDRLAGVLSVTGFVASAEGFVEQPAVLNGASDLMVEIFGEAGRHARIAVGAAALPMGAPVEVALVLELEP